MSRQKKSVKRSKQGVEMIHELTYNHVRKYPEGKKQPIKWMKLIAHFRPGVTLIKLQF